MSKTPAPKPARARAPAAEKPFSPFYVPPQFDTPRDAPGADRMGPDASGFAITPPVPNAAMNALIRGKKKQGG
ncbi:MAG: hypothetical protein WCI67_16125 [Chloroflexales bacterium]